MARPTGAREMVACMYMPLAVEEGALVVQETGDKSAEEMSDHEGTFVEPPGRQRARGAAAAALGAFGMLTGFALVAIAVLPKLPEKPSDADVDKSMEAFGGFELAATLADGITAAAKVVQDAKKTYPDLKRIGTPTERLRDKALHSGVHPLLNLSHYANLTEAANMPADNRNDGNLCPDDEEEAGGLCYRRCKDLTGGEYPVRTGAFSCCQSFPCTFFNSVFSNPLNFCDGYDTAGVKEQGGCPHTPGDCFKNEEFFLGTCYMKCALLTQNAFPYRAAADSCCRYNSHLACLDALNVFTNATLNRGGGYPDGVRPEAPTVGAANAEPESHQPILSLTEKKSHWS